MARVILHSWLGVLLLGGPAQATPSAPHADTSVHAVAGLVPLDSRTQCTGNCGRKASATHFDWHTRAQYAQRGCLEDEPLACRYLGMALAEGLGGAPSLPDRGAELLWWACERGDRGACTVGWLLTGRVEYEPHLLLKPAEKECKSSGDGLACLGNLLARTDPGVQARHEAVTSPDFYEKRVDKATRERVGAGYYQSLSHLKDIESMCDGDLDVCPLVDSGSPTLVLAVARARRLANQMPAPPERILQELPIPDPGVDCTSRPSACRDAGIAFQRGEGAEQNDRMAVALWSAGCRARDAASCGALAWMLDKGYGVAIDYPRSLAMREKACQLGHTPSCEMLGVETSPDYKHLQDIRRCYEARDVDGCERLKQDLWVVGGPSLPGFARDPFAYAGLQQRMCELGAVTRCATLHSYAAEVWISGERPNSRGWYKGHELNEMGRMCMAPGSPDLSPPCVHFRIRDTSPARAVWVSDLCREKGYYCPKEGNGQLMADVLAVAGAVAGEVAPELNNAALGTAVAVGGQIVTAKAQSMGVSRDAALIVQGVSQVGEDLRAFDTERAIEEQRAVEQRRQDHRSALVQADTGEAPETGNQPSNTENDDHYCRWGGNSAEPIYFHLDVAGRYPESMSVALDNAPPGTKGGVVLLCADEGVAVLMPQTAAPDQGSVSCGHDLDGIWADRGNTSRWTRDDQRCDTAHYAMGELWAERRPIARPPPPPPPSQPLPSATPVDKSNLPAPKWE